VRISRASSAKSRHVRCVALYWRSYCLSITSAARLCDELDRVRADGVAFDREECDPGVACVAAPVIGPGDVCISAVSITGPADRLRLERLTSAVRTTALAIAHTLRSA